MSEDYQIISLNEMESFITKCMVIVGSKEEHAKILANCLVAADFRGHYSHGVNRICKFLSI